MQSSCRQCGQQFDITSEDLKFYETMQVPAPASCPECRLIRRLQERNTRNLYYRKCDFTGEKIVSQFPESVPFPVYKSDIWWSDKWDALKYGKPFDFSKTFFEQFKALKNSVPQQSLYVISNMENSEYTNCAGYLKNCYLIFESDYDEDCYYSNLLKKCKNLVDCSICYDSELCYECIDCMCCYSIKYSQDCQNCQDSFFLKNCQGCKNCIGCINQKHKEYMIFNKQYSKVDYEKMKKEIALNDWKKVEELKVQVDEFFKGQIIKALEAENNENCLGNHLYNSKNSSYCFDSKDLEDCKYCARLSLSVKSSMDYNSWGDKAELVYQCSSCGDNIYNLKFCTTCTSNVSDSEYCDSCSNSQYLFGCAGVNHKKYCILNVQYTQEEYELLKAKIIEHMKKTGEYGEYFPNDICPFAYNESIAPAYFPMTKEEVLKRGYKWTDKELFNHYQGQSASVKDKIEDVEDSVTKDILACRICSKNYRIVPQELKFYRFNNVPLPKDCADCRYEKRMKKRQPIKLIDRKCAKCSAEIKTTYAPDRPEIVYCEGCYLKEVY